LTFDINYVFIFSGKIIKHTGAIGMKKDIRVTIKVRNNLILMKMEERGITSVAALCNQIKQHLSGSTTKIDPVNVYRLVNMKDQALKLDGSWSKTAVILAEFFKCLPSDLFSVQQQQRALAKNISQVEATFAEIELLTTQQTTPELLVQAAEFHEAIHSALTKLTEQQRYVLVRRFGIDCEEMTLEAIGQTLNMNREQVRQIEAKALRKLKHPSLFRPIIAAALISSEAGSGPHGYTHTSLTIDGDVMEALNKL
jgi:RNA polymerase sigma factor (sigma-70 family)